MAEGAQSCGRCRFHRMRKIAPAQKKQAVAAGVDLSIGRCRRFPQEVEKSAADWCGEFEGKS